MTKKEFYSELESMLEQEPGSIQGTELLSDLPGWDSMAVLTFIALADTKLGVVPSPSAIAACRGVQDLEGLFPAHIS